VSFSPLSRAVFLAAVAANVALRLLLAAVPGYPGDVEEYRDWAIGAAIWGLPAAYEKTTIDYTPGILYLFAPIGHLYVALHPEIASAEVHRAPWGEYLFQMEDGTFYRSWTPGPDVPDPTVPATPLPDLGLLTLLIKLSFFFFDLLLAALLYALVAAGGYWGEARGGPSWGRLVAVLYLWNPAVVFDIGYWGQADGIHCLLVVASLALVSKGRWFASGFLLSSACLVKPLAVPLVPLLALVAALKGRLRGFVLAGAGGLIAAVVVFLPFIVTGRGPTVFEQTVLGIYALPEMSHASANGHSLWWLLGAWREATAPVIAGLSRQQLGQILFLPLYVLLLAAAGRRALRDRDFAPEAGARLFLVGAAIYYTFFFLSTHMHENHLLLAIPLLLAVAGRSRSLAWLAALCTLTSFLNMALHDDRLLSLLPEILGGPASASRLFAPFPLSWIQVVGSVANTVFAGIVCVMVYVAAWRQLREEPR